MCKKRYVMIVSKLPGEIIPEQCQYTVYDDMVELILRKRVNKSWVDEIRGGLIQAD
ncbi:unnamed protein product [Echinostoma caproni]|uniref:CS domain-containing protein n=1 Tax=Echinostoma caproni TaxID=27848 RepID=A0A183A3T7_9TREM|nr:unnamed protein product [Echinostoma caproni]